MGPGVVGVIITIAVATVIVLATWIITRHLGASRQAKALVDGDHQYRALADEYRRLSDVAITAQEHTDLRLADLGVQMDALREKLEQMQRILQDVE